MSHSPITSNDPAARRESLLMPICFSSEVPFTLDRALSLPRQEISRPWLHLQPQEDGLESLSSPIRWSLALDSKALWFCASIPGSPIYDTCLKGGEFVEGLWESDVAEFFLRDGHTGAYQEFNVSPAGAWWTCYFSAYRQRAAVNHRPETICTHASTDRSSWQVAFAVRTDELSVALDRNTQLHVAFIRALPTDSSKQEFFSSRPLPGIEPDFHCAEVFAPIQFEAL